MQSSTMSDDKENQSDEISVLQSIYNDEELIVENNDDTYSGQFYALVSVKEKFLVIYKNLMNSADELESIEVDYLPPICLYFSLPKNYPSVSPPNYKLSCSWLSVKCMVYLSVKFEELWKQNFGTPILFIWIDFLKNEALGHLDITNYLDARGIFTKELKNRSRKENLDARKKCSGNRSTLWEERKRCWEERKRIKAKSHSSYKSKRLDNDNKISDQSEPKSAFVKTDQPCNLSSSEIINLDANNVGQNVKSDEPPESISPCGQSPPSPQKNNQKFVEAVKEKFGIDVRRPKFMDSLTCPIIFNHLHRVERKTNSNIISFLVGYNEDRIISEFKKGHYNCDICFQIQVGAKCTQFKPCNHVYCAECIHSFFSVRLNENTVKNMPCPHDKCSSEASQHQIKEVLGEELYARYDRLLLNVTLDTMSDVVYCPRKGCQLPVLVESDRMAYCPSCSFAFCALCLRTYHGVQPCAMKNEEKKKLAMKYSEAGPAERTLLEARYGKQQLVTLLQNVLSSDWISEHSKGCPCCKTSIEKSDGCNKMVCTKCNTMFCWLCYAVLDKEAPYKHFYDFNSKCFNKLFFGYIGDEDDDDDDDDNEDDEDDDVDIDLDDIDDDFFLIYGEVDEYDVFVFDEPYQEGFPGWP